MTSTLLTVLGPVAPQTVDYILTHEHLQMNFAKNYKDPVNLKDVIKEKLAEKIKLNNLGIIKQYPYSSKYNLSLNDEDSRNAITKELLLLNRIAGKGACIVDNSNHGLERNATFQKNVAEKARVHIISGTGHYVANFQTASTLALSEEELVTLYRKELCEGTIEDPQVRCGFIGEVGSDWPLQDFERRCIRATATVQAELGCPVSFHPGRNRRAPREIMRIYLEAGGNRQKAVMSHLERTYPKIEDVLNFAEMGSFLQFDLFGTEVLTYQLEPKAHMPTDHERIAWVQRLIKEGLVDRILLSHDIHTKHRLTEYGGHGFWHIKSNIAPKMELMGITAFQVKKLISENPKKWLLWETDGHLKTK